MLMDWMLRKRKDSTVASDPSSWEDVEPLVQMRKTRKENSTI